MMQMYDYSLVAALSLLLFFAVYFLVAKTPDKPIFAVYVRSRRIMGLLFLFSHAITSFIFLSVCVS